MAYTEREYFFVNFLSGNMQAEHMHQEIELIYVVEGEIELKLLDQRFVMRSNDCIVVNSNHRHQWRALEKVCLCVLHVDYKFLMDYVGKPLLIFYCNSTQEADNKYEGLKTIMGDLLSECAVNPDKNTLMKSSQVYRLLSYLVMFFTSDGVEGDKSRTDLRFSQLLLYIHANSGRKIYLKEMADLLCIAPSSFSRYFKKYAGMTFEDYLKNVRLQFAMEDLIYTDAPVTVIAENNGFTNVSAFCRYFKDAYGASPHSFRKKRLEMPGNAAVPGTSENVAAPELLKKPVEFKASERLGELLRPYRERSLMHIWQPWKQHMLSVRIDSEGHREKVDHLWAEAVYLGASHLLLSSRYKEQVRMARKYLGFTYVRVDRVFFERMGLRQGHEMSISNFELLDDVFDFLVKEQMIPIISIDNKPDSTIKDMDRPMRDYENIVLFETIEECLSVVSCFLKHVLSRYGMAVVRRWSFDCFYDEYHGHMLGIRGSFVEAFAKLSACIKRHIPEASVGGCGLTPAVNEAAFRKVMREWAASQVKPDFISIDLYPYDREMDERNIRLKRRSMDTFYLEELNRVKSICKYVGLGEIPVKVMGWNMSLSQNNSFNDSCAKAAIMLSQMCTLSGQAALVIYNGLSDMTVAAAGPSLLFSGKWGLICSQGICKPAFWALYFWGRLLPFWLSRGEHYVVTADEEGHYAILCFNDKQFYGSYYLKNETGIDRETMEYAFVNKEGLEISFCMTHMKGAAYVVKSYSISTEYGSIQEEAQRIGLKSEEPAMPEEISYLKHRCTPLLRKKYVDTNEGTLSFLETLYAHEIRLLLITPSE